MKIPFAKSSITLLGALLMLTSSQMQAGPWSLISEEELDAAKSGGVAEAWIQPIAFQGLMLDTSAMDALLKGAPLEGEKGRELVMEIPMPDGTTVPFLVESSPIMAPDLEAWMASEGLPIKTYRLTRKDDPTCTGRMDWGGARGFHAMITGGDLRATVFIDPFWKDDAERHVSYWRDDYFDADKLFRCSALPNPEGIAGKGDRAATREKGADGFLETYRLAVAATGEYTAFHGGTAALGQAAIVTTINRVNQVYERDLAVRLLLIANNQTLVYTNASTDPFTNDDGDALLDENQATLTSRIGSGSYDIGHVFSTGGGGVAILGSVCSASYKAMGVTGSPAPVGDAYDVDYVCHEIGHQFGAQHTFNSETGACGGGNRNPSTAVEPGSGSTIMAYAGICGVNDLQVNSDAYFHGVSISEIYSFLSSVNCAARPIHPNLEIPVLLTGPARYIPANTPFVLTAEATDPEGFSVTYAFEQIDLGASRDLTAGDNGSSPLFRSYPPSSNGFRFFPRIQNILSGEASNLERLPTTSRRLLFQVTARDNHPGAGLTSFGYQRLDVVNTAGPFVVTAPSGTSSRNGLITVQWNVANTNTAPVNATQVGIYLSKNGGQTFEVILAEGVANSGSAQVVLPNEAIAQARIMVMASDNYFLAVNNANFPVTSGTPVPLLQNAGASVTGEIVGNSNGYTEPGEDIAVQVTARNTGTAPATNITGTLTSLTPTASIVEGTAAWPDIPADDADVALAPFTVRIASSHPCGNPVQLRVTFNYTGGQHTADFQLPTGKINQGPSQGSYNFNTDAVGWTTQVLAGTNNWARRTSTNASSTPTVYSYLFTNSGTNDVALLSPTISGAETLIFYHTFGFESGYDGGILEITTNNGTSWTDLGSRIISGGYNGIISNDDGSRIAGRSAWTGGARGTMTRVEVDLSDYFSSTIRVRFRPVSDASVQSSGWEIDDVEFLGPEFSSCEANLVNGEGFQVY